jgi:general secretion pathway protein B
MSFILDALRKSEIERQRQSGPSIAELPVAREDRRLPVALLAIGLLLVVNVGVLLFFLLRDAGVPEPAGTPAAVAAAPAAAVPGPAPGLASASPPIAPATGENSAQAPATTASVVALTAGLPELSVDLHIYADDPAKRAVFINGRRYTQGDSIAEGPRVEEITRDGAVLNYRGQRFLLPRL